MRVLYEYLLLMHPQSFRRRFAAEMLCIFDEALPCTGALPLLFDGFASLARQWVLRSESWKLAAAVFGGCLQVMVGGLIWVALRDAGSTHANVSGPQVVALDRLMRFIVASVGGIVLMVTITSLWMARFFRKRACGRKAAR